MNKKIIKSIFTIILCIIIGFQLIALSYAFIKMLDNKKPGGIDYENTYLLPPGYITIILYIAFLCIALKPELSIKLFKYVSIFIVIYLIILCFIPVINVYYFVSPSGVGVDINGNYYAHQSVSNNFTIYEYIFETGGILIKW